MGLLDALFSNNTGGQGGGLLSYLVPQPEYDPMGNHNGITSFPPNPFVQESQPAQSQPSVSPNLLYPSPLQPKQDDFVSALRQGATEGALPQLAAPASPWDQPGINYGPAPAPSVFSGGAAPVPGYASAPQAAPAPQVPAAAAPAPSAAAPSPQNDPINTMNVGGYQMPQFGSAQDYTPQVASAPAAQGGPTDVSAQSRQQEPQSLPPALGGGVSALGRIFNPDGLVARLTGNDTRSQAQQNLNAQFHAIQRTLVDGGMSPREAQSKAMLAVMNPEAGKTILSEALTNKEQFKTITDAMGNQVPIFVNERDQTINGKPIGQSDVANQSGGFLAPGVKSIDSTLKGNDYIGQFSPEVQAAVKDYVDGKSMPTGNPRKGFTQTVKMIAQKYGADTGQSVDDTTYAARRTMRNQLSSSAPSSLGGQINIGNTAAGHLADLTQKAIELGNVDTGIAPLTAGINNLRGLGTEQAAKMEALKGAAQHYGQEITKFYAGSPGGTAERDRFIESVNGARSPKELAAILATEGELMRSRLDALGGQIKGVLGEEGSKQYPVLRADGQAALAKVEENVSRLKGNQPASAPGGIPSGWSVKVH